MKLQQQTEADTKAEIAELRQRYLRLKAICGLQHISQQTLQDYSKKIVELENQLKK
jgi:hypothetical protein